MKRVKRKKKVSRKIIPMPIYVSPDGGETVYEQLPNGERKLVEQSQQARIIRPRMMSWRWWE